MYRNTSDVRIAVIALAIALIALVVSALSIFAAYQAGLTSARVHFVAEQAQRTTEEANSLITQVNSIAEQANSAAEQATTLASEAKDIANRYEIIRQVFVTDRRLRTSLARCYQAYIDGRYNRVVVAARLAEHCNLPQLARRMTLLSNYSFEELLAAQDERCLASYTTAHTLVDTARLRNDHTFLIAIFDPTSDLAPIVVEPAPDIAHLLGCLGEVSEEEVHDFYSELLAIETE